MAIAQSNYAAAASALPGFVAAPTEFVWAQAESEAAHASSHASYAHSSLTAQPPQQHQQLQTVQVIPAMVEVDAVVVPLDMKGLGAKRKRAVHRTEAADGEAGFKPAPLPKLPRTKTKRTPAAAVVPEEAPTAARKRSVTQQSFQGPRRFRSPFCNCEVHLATNRGGLFNLSHRIIHQQPNTTCETVRYCLRTQYESSSVNKPQQRVTLYVSAASGLVNLRALFSSEDALDSLTTTSANVEKLGPGALWNGHPVGATPGHGAPGSELLLPAVSAVQALGGQ